MHIRNIGGFAIPFDIVEKYTDGSSMRFHQTSALWKSNPVQTLITLPIPSGKKLQSIQLDNGIYVDADASNNTWMGK